MHVMKIIHNLTLPTPAAAYTGGHKIYNFGRPFLGHPYFILSFSDLCRGADREKDFSRNYAFSLLTYLVTP